MTAFDPSVIQWPDVFISLILVAFSLFIVYFLKLDMSKLLLIGTFRSFIQLILLGYVLHFIFQIQNAWHFLLIMTVIVFYASFEATRRQSIKIPNYYFIEVIALGIAVFLVLGTILLVILDLTPWFRPIVSIPLGGMIIGQSLNSSSLLANTFSRSIRDRQLQIETVLSLGATRWQAILPILKESLKNALIPSINSLNTVGLVSIPGVMVGALIGGVEPMVAVKYQILVMYLWISGTTIACTITGLLVSFQFLNKDHQLLTQLLQSPSNNKG